MDLFLKVIEEKLSGNKTNSVLAVATEIIAGFMRSSKCFKAKSIEKITQACYKLIYTIFKLTPLEVLLFIKLIR